MSKGIKPGKRTYFQNICLLNEKKYGMIRKS